MKLFVSPIIKHIHLASVLMALTIALSAAVNAATVNRIISTDAGVTDVLIALGVVESLVGVDVTSQVPASLKLPKVGYHRTLSAEGLMSLKPTLIIGSDHMGPPEVISFFDKSGVKLVRLPIAKNAQQLKRNITTIGELVERESTAGELLARVDSAMLTLGQQQLGAATKVAFLLQMDGRSLRLAGSSTTGDDIISLLGGDNIAEHNAYQVVSPEALINLAPEVIIVVSRGATDSLVANLLSDNPLLAHTPAAANAKIIEFDGRSIVAGISVSAIETIALLSIKLN